MLTAERPAVQDFIDTEYATKYGAYCLDGSIPDFYYRSGVGDGINKYQIYLQGGGWCKSIQNCVNRTISNLGSIYSLGTSKYDNKYWNLSSEPGAPYLSSQQSLNPLTFSWNTIFIRYCDGFSFSSNNDTIYKYNDTINLYFRGWRNLNGVLNKLVSSYNLSTATDVILSGCSAGGLSVFFHNNYIYQFISKLKNGESFKFMAMVDAGYFMQNVHVQSEMTFVYNYGNVTDGLNQQCLNYYKQNDLDITQCLYAFNIAPFINTKMFSLQSQYDMIQIEKMNLTGNVTAINQYGQNLTYWYIERYINTGNNNHYGWLVSCYQHCTQNPNEIWDKIIINGYTVSDAQIDVWYDNATYGQLLFQNNTYPCDACCGSNS